MITPNDVFGMSEVEQGQSKAFENAIDTAIQAQSALDPEQKSFELDQIMFTSDAAPLTVKVRENTFARYRKAGWNISVTEKSYIFSAPEKKHRGRAKGSKNKPKVTVTAPVAVTETAPVAALPAVEVVA